MTISTHRLQSFKSFVVVNLIVILISSVVVGLHQNHKELREQVVLISAGYLPVSPAHKYTPAETAGIHTNLQSNKNTTNTQASHPVDSEKKIGQASEAITSNKSTMETQADDPVPPYMQHMTVILVILHMSVFITGLVGNSLVCLSVYRNKSLQTVTNYYIVNLAVADFLVILICLPPTVYWDLTLTWNFGLVLCKLVPYLQSTSVSVSVLTLTCISIDRWYAICRPLKFSSTKYRAKITIGLIWLVSAIIASPDAMFLTTQPQYEEDNYVYFDCTYSWPESSTKIYQLCIVTLLFVGPFVLMSISYSHIVNVLWRNETMTESIEHSIQQPDEEQQTTKRKWVTANTEQKPQQQQPSISITRTNNQDANPVAANQVPEANSNQQQSSYCEHSVCSSPHKTQVKLKLTAREQSCDERCNNEPSDQATNCYCSSTTADEHRNECTTSGCECSQYCSQLEAPSGECSGQQRRLSATALNCDANGVAREVILPGDAQINNNNNNISDGRRHTVDCLPGGGGGGLSVKSSTSCDCWSGRKLLLGAATKGNINVMQLSPLNAVPSEASKWPPTTTTTTTTTMEPKQPSLTSRAAQMSQHQSAATAGIISLGFGSERQKAFEEAEKLSNGVFKAHECQQQQHPPVVPMKAPSHCDRSISRYEQLDGPTVAPLDCDGVVLISLKHPKINEGSLHDCEGGENPAVVVVVEPMDATPDSSKDRRQSTMDKQVGGRDEGASQSKKPIDSEKAVLVANGSGGCSSGNNIGLRPSSSTAINENDRQQCDKFASICSSRPIDNSRERELDDDDVSLPRTPLTATLSKTTEADNNRFAPKLSRHQQSAVIDPYRWCACFRWRSSAITDGSDGRKRQRLIGGKQRSMDKMTKRYRKNLANYAAKRDKYSTSSAYRQPVSASRRSHRGIEAAKPPTMLNVPVVTDCSYSKQELDNFGLTIPTCTQQNRTTSGFTLSPTSPYSDVTNELNNNAKGGRHLQHELISVSLAHNHSNHHHQRQEQQQQQQQKQEQLARFNTRFCKLIESRKKAAKMLIVIVIMFGLCYLPIHFLNTLRYTIGLPQNDITTIASLVSHWLCYFNSAVNPLIYNLMSGKFRHEFANLFFCKCFRRGLSNTN